MQDHGPTILVVDDSESFRTLTQALLEHLGYHVLEAEGCDQAVAAAQRECVDLAVVDMIMPEKDGLVTIQALRKVSPGMSFVACSGSDEVLFRAKLDALGVAAFIAKPFRIEQLAHLIEETLAGSPPAAVAVARSSATAVAA